MRRSLALMVCLWVGLAQAATIETPLPDAAQEAQARALFRELRCVVCEGQAVADSDAVLAAQMRAQVRLLLAEGKTPDHVLIYFRERYGDEILLTPRLQSHTALLWLAPLLILSIGGALAWRYALRTREAA
jgi:cytochrome c-type biogenesis protein CcmH